MDESYRKQLSVHDRYVLIEILDTNQHHEYYDALMDQFMRVITIFIVVYSVTNRQSFEEVEKWFNKIERYKDGSPYAAVLVG